MSNIRIYCFLLGKLSELLLILEMEFEIIFSSLFLHFYVTEQELYLIHSRKVLLMALPDCLHFIFNFELILTDHQNVKLSSTNILVHIMSNV